MTGMKSLCVYCGSNVGRSPRYAEAARSLAQAMAEREITLVYGGAHVGIMGILADTMLEAGGRVIGIMPQSLVDKEVAHDGLSELHVTDGMHERKALMEKLSDGFVALPGGLGTMDELFEIWTWGQLGFHAKPVGLLNVNGYYDALLQFLDNTVAQGYVREEHRRMLHATTEANEMLDWMNEYEPPSSGKWKV